METAAEELVPVPSSAVSFPLEVPPPPGFEPDRIETWPQTAGRFEYVDGRLLYMPPTGYEQQYTCADLAFVLRTWTETHPGFRVGGNEAGMLLDGTTRAADAGVWRASDPRPATGELQRVPPVLAAEVAGKYDTEAALTDKASWYLAHGVMVVWLIDPSSRTITVLTAHGEERYGSGQQLREQAVLPGLAPAVDAFFRQLSNDD